MNIHYFQHVPFEGLGCIETWTKSHSLTATRFFNADPLPDLAELDWLIVMGGPMSVHDTTIYPWLYEEKNFIKQAIAQEKKVLGICLGAQLIAEVLGAHVYPNPQKEIGWFPIVPTTVGTFLPAQVMAFHWHGETFDLPEGAVHLARSEACQHQIFTYGQQVIGLQCHLEMTQADIKAIVTHCRDELIEAPYIQTAEAILNNTQHFASAHQLMRTLLDQFACQ